MDATPSPERSTGRAPGMGFIMATVLIDLMGVGIILPVLPLIVGEFTSSSDSHAHWVGLMTTTFAAAQFLLAPLLGAVSDRFGRRPILLLGIAALGVNFALTAIAPSLAWLLVARLIGGGLSSNIAVANAYVADITPPEKRAKRFGQLGAAFGVGFIVGPVIGGFAGQWGLHYPFYVAAGLCAINFIYGYFVLPESLARENRSPVNFRRANPFSALQGLSALRGVGSLVAVVFFANLAQFMVHGVWVLYVAYRFGWSPQTIGFSFMAVGVGSALSQGLLLPKLIKRLGAEKLAMLGLASSGIAAVLWGLTTVGWFIFVILLANLLSYAAAPSIQSLISRAAPADKQGTTMGALSALNSLTLVIAPLFSTWVFAMVSHYDAKDLLVGLPFFVSAATTFIALAIAYRHFNRTPVPVPAP
ncbi:TCR/Tet family MFS transporter [soil metagenome]